MRFGPELGGEIRGDAGGEKGEAGSDGEEDPEELDAALEHEVVEKTEDQDEHGGFGEEGGAAAAGDDHEIRTTRREVGWAIGWDRGHQAEVVGGWGGAIGVLEA